LDGLYADCVVGQLTCDPLRATRWKDWACVTCLRWAGVDLTPVACRRGGARRVTQRPGGAALRSTSMPFEVRLGLLL
ncbi:hypothetical protein PSHT_09877, partial [Puccinia striiformis]